VGVCPQLQNKEPMKTTDVTLDLIAKVLIRCFWIGMALIMGLFFLYLAVGDWGYELHKNIWPGLTRHAYSLIWACILSFFKTLIFVAFLVPYIAIRMVIRQQPSVAENDGNR